jgi:ABC-type branched-subunit amino acid transport system ATPase component
MLELRSISKRFGGVDALIDISISINKDLVGIVGPNGSGKTTLFNIISGHVRQDRGEVFFMGREISRLSIGERVRIGILRTFQMPKVFWSLSVWDNIAPLARDRVYAVEAMKRLDLWSKRDLMPRRLALSDIRRLEIARCLVLSPRILLLDEPLAGLSHKEAEDLGILISEIHRDLGIPVAVIEHKLGHLSRIARRVVAMNAGRIVIDAPTDEAMTRVREMLLGL